MIARIVMDYEIIGFMTDMLTRTTPPEAARPAQNKEIRFTVKRKNENY